LEEAKEVLQKGNKEVAGGGNKNAREVGQLAAEAIRGYWQRKERLEQIKVEQI
jgi:hypothetical protein